MRTRRMEEDWTGQTWELREDGNEDTKRGEKEIATARNKWEKGEKQQNGNDKLGNKYRVWRRKLRIK